MQFLYMICAAAMAACAVNSAIKKQQGWCSAFVFMFVIDICGFMGELK